MLGIEERQHNNPEDGWKDRQWVDGEVPKNSSHNRVSFKDPGRVIKMGAGSKDQGTVNKKKTG
eukprot:scaffold95576_cov34-Attheya_sp.AAC.1